MRFMLDRLGFCVALLGAVLLTPSPGQGQARIEMADGRWVTLGGGVRTSFRSTELFPGSPYEHNINLESVRLYVNSLVHENIGLELNTEYGGDDGELRVLDAVVKYTPSPYFNIWMGRHLPPSDRANLDGPYYLSTYDYPGLVSRYPAIFAGRDNGVSFSGQVEEGVFKYAFGVYDGVDTVVGDNNMLYAARFVYNFLEPEPGYYNSSTYYGDKDVLALGFAVQRQADVIDLGLEAGDFTGYNFDLLFEKSLAGGGTVSLEGAFYDYDLDGLPGEGSGFLAQAGYLFPQRIGPGLVQPTFRYQDFETQSIWDAGVNYVIRGHNARISLIFSQADFGGEDNTANRFTLGTQFQF